MKIKKSKVTLITGATSGIGRELAKCFAEQKNDLVLVARRQNRLEEIKKLIEKSNKVNVTIIKADITDSEDVSNIVKIINDEKLSIHTLVNNAGVGGHGFFYERSLESNINMINLNVTALTKLTHIFMSDIIKNNGQILNIASTAGMIPGPLQSVYYATKAYVLSFSQAIAEELRDKNVIVTAFCPGATKTEFADNSNLLESKLFNSRLLEASEVAKQAMKALKNKKLVDTSESLQTFQLRFIVPFLPRKLALKISRSVMETNLT